MIEQKIFHFEFPVCLKSFVVYGVCIISSLVVLYSDDYVFGVSAFFNLLCWSQIHFYGSQSRKDVTFMCYEHEGTVFL